jgi:prepilin-type N-terminal cleavage/methylation domain-containing protein
VRSSLAEQQGLTLAEVLAALTVLSIGLVAMIALLPLAASGVHEGGHRSSAVFLAAERLEQIRHAVGSGAGLHAFLDEPALPPPHGAFGRMVRIRDCSLPPGCAGAEIPTFNQVTVTVSYPAAGAAGPAPARHAAVVLSTYIGPR